MGLLDSGHLEELRRALIAAGYEDPWPELDTVAGLQPSPSTANLGLRPEIESALLRARLRTLARILGTPVDDLMEVLSWDQYDELRRRLVELGYLEPGNIEA